MSGNSLLLFAACILFTISCKTATAPKGTVPNRNGIAWDGRGGWITLSFADSAREQINGEFLALGQDSVYIMNSETFSATPIADVRSARIIMYNTETTAYAIWTFLSSLLTISNGAFLILTLPLNLITGISTTVGESRRLNYFDYPENDWAELNKYTRFPQGIDRINRKELLFRKTE